MLTIQIVHIGHHNQNTLDYNNNTVLKLKQFHMEANAISAITVFVNKLRVVVSAPFGGLAVHILCACLLVTKIRETSDSR